jgi:hypothetical protein
LNAIAQVEEYVRSSGHMHTWNGEIFYSDNGRIKTSSLMSHSAYRSAGSLDGTTNTISSMSSMPDFKTRFPCLDYTIEMVLPGQSGNIQLQQNSGPFLLWGAERKPSFFDAEVFTPTALTCYRSKYSVPGLEHSGDIISGAHFMHSVSCNTFGNTGEAGRRWRRGQRRGRFVPHASKEYGEVCSIDDAIGVVHAPVCDKRS